MQHQYNPQGHQPQMPTNDHSNGPPSRRPKTGEMVITRYAPPPGYVHPAAQNPPYNAWSQATPGASVQQPYDASMQQAQQYWAAYGYSYPAYLAHPEYSAYSGYYQGWPAHSYAQPPYPTHAPQSAHTLTSHSAVWPVPPPPQNPAEQAARQRHNSAPSINFAVPFVQDKISGPNDELDEEHEDYCEYTRPCSFASCESEIVKNWSLGIIHMKTALPAHKALPATWTEANEIASAPDPKEKYDADRCVSFYHSSEQLHNQLGPVHAKAEWKDIRNDLIFRRLPATTSDLVSLSRLKSDFRNRVDPVWLANKPNLRRPSVQQSQKKSTDQYSSSNKKRGLSQTESEQVGDGHTKRSRQQSVSHDRHHGTNRSPSRNARHVYNDRRAGHSPQQDDQDTALARLGVTGLSRPTSHYGLPQTTDPGTSPPENKWARLAREHYPGNKRGFDHEQEDSQQREKGAGEMHQDKRRK